MGSVRCAGLYRAAQQGTLVGGDFFDVREGPCGVRVVMGDVQGHGLSAVATVASLLGAFREAVLDRPDPESVAARLDRRLMVDSAAVRHSELFATAVVLEFGGGAEAVRIVACGQPGPVLLRDGLAVELDAPVGTPLGLGLSDGAYPAGLTVPLRPGDRLFLASDGVWEARNSAGAFYPLLDRLVEFSADGPAKPGRAAGPRRAGVERPGALRPRTRGRRHDARSRARRSGVPLTASSDSCSPSASMCGRIRSSHRGVHQACLPAGS